MNKKIINIILLLTITINGFSQVDTNTIKGFVYDDKTDGAMPFTNVRIFNNTYYNVTTTNFDGFFNLKIPNGIYTIEIAYVGYKKKIINDFKVSGNNKTLHFCLKNEYQYLRTLPVIHKKILLKEKYRIKK